MGNCMNPSKSDGARISEIDGDRKIEAKLEKAKEELSKETNVLILGTGDSGKTTLMKQLLILYSSGFDRGLQKRYKSTIRHNIVEHMRLLCEEHERRRLARQENSSSSDSESGSEEDEKKKQKKKVQSYIDKFLEVNITEVNEETKSYNRLIKKLWESEEIQEIYKTRHKIQVPDSAFHFFNAIDRIASEKYSPSEKDILFCRIPTTGVKCVDFNVNEYTWKVTDVGGQRSERRKWIHHFDNTDLIVYVISIAEYDQNLYEDDSFNRMEESLTLLHRTVNEEVFAGTDIAVLFNKEDLLQQKIESGITKFSDYFPEFDGNDDSVEDVKNFIAKMFLSKINVDDNRQVRSFFSRLIDTNSFSKTWNEIQSFIFNKIIEDEDDDESESEGNTSSSSDSESNSD